MRRYGGSVGKITNLFGWVVVMMMMIIMMMMMMMMIIMIMTMTIAIITAIIITATVATTMIQVRGHGAAGAQRRGDCSRQEQVGKP